MALEKPLDSSDFRVHVGAYGICRDQEGRLLLVRMCVGPDAGRWTLPGGGVRWGEHPEETVIREMEEETGLVGLDLGSVIGIYSHTYNQITDDLPPPLHHLGLIYRLDSPSYDLRFEMGGTTDLCSWLAEDQARALPLTPLGEFGVNLAWPAGDN